MNINIYQLAIIFSLLFIVWVLDKVRRGKLQEKYSIMWIFFASVLIVCSAIPNVSLIVAQLLEVKYAPAFIFLVGFLFLLLYVFHLTQTVSQQNKKIIKLAEEVAILNKKVECTKEEK